MRFRSVLIYLWPVIFLSAPTVSAQKKVFATVRPNAAAYSASADIYDPQTGKITAVSGKLVTAREQQMAVRLNGGKILLAGGYNDGYLRTAELFDPSKGTFTETRGDTSVSSWTEGKMLYARTGGASVLLQGGTVLVLGGFNGGYLAYAETYDPATDKFTSTTGSMNVERQYATATLMTSGDVLVIGGYNDSSYFLNTAEIYGVKSRNFTATKGSMTDARVRHASALLSNGKILVTGGCRSTESGVAVCNQYLSSVEIYDPSTELFTTSDNSMTAARMNHTATLLPNGKVLLVGGSDGSSPLSTAELYDPVADKFTATGSMSAARVFHTATLLSSGKVLIAGGYSDHYLTSAEIYDPQTGVFTPVATPMSVPRSQHTATAMSDGRVLLAGGQNSDLLAFDVNYQKSSDNLAPNILFSSDSKTGFVSYTGSGVVLAFSSTTGEVLKRITTGGSPTWLTMMPDGVSIAAVSALDSKIFIIDSKNLTLRTTYTYTGLFGFGSMITLSPDGSAAYISSTGTGEVIKFDPATGKESSRLTGLSAPAQITVTKDGKTLIVVDVTENALYFVYASSMRSKSKILASDTDASASFNIFNRLVLNKEETYGVIASQDTALFLVNASTAEIEKTLIVGSSPGYTLLTPGGSFWLVLCDGTLSIVPTWDPESLKNSSAVIGSPLKSANIVLSPESRYAFYASAAADHIYQHDIGTEAVVGSIQVGDEHDVNEDEASSLAFTPDFTTLAVLNFAANQVDLLSDTTVIKQTKFVSEQEKFTGVSIVNLSGAPANLTFTAMSDGGAEYSATDIVNPVTVQLPANAQKTFDVSQMFNLDADQSNSGYLVVSSDQPSIAGFSEVGQIHSSFLGSYLSNVQGVPFYTDLGKQLHDFIIPELPQEKNDKTPTTELNFVNPNYNSSSFDLTYYGEDGTVIETKDDNTVAGAARLTKQVSDFVTSSQAGEVVLMGGYDASSTKRSAELFSVNSFSLAAGSMTTARQGHTATVLLDKTVLAAGGKNGSSILSSAEIFDPVASTFSTDGGAMNVERFRHTATLLPNGKVLVAGGQNSSSINGTAELYDIDTSAFAYSKSVMTSPRDAHTATLLANGKVLLVGGLDGNGTSATAETYDPAADKFTSTGSMSARRAFHTAVALPNGKVLIAGGYNGTYLNSAELYDPATGAFSSTAAMTTARSWHTATLLDNGTVLIAGGINTSGTLSSAEIYDPDAGTFLPTTGDMVSARNSHTATAFISSTASTQSVVLVGGNDGTETLTSAEVYDPATRQFTSSGSLNVARQGHTATYIEAATKGFFRVKSDIGLLFTEIYDNTGADTAISGINVDQFKDIKKIYSPQFATLPDYITQLNVINANEDSEATVTVTLHASDGTVLAGPKSWVLHENGQLKGNLLDLFSDNSKLANKTGWVEVSSTVDRIVGAISFTNSKDTFLTSFQLSGTPIYDFAFPLIAEDSDYSTGIALLNSGDTAANVRLELWGTSGTLDAAASVVLAPHTQLAQPLRQLFQGMRDHRSGNVRVHSDRPLHANAVLYSLDLHFISSVTAVPYPGQ
jgi:hypothetical protein